MNGAVRQALARASAPEIPVGIRSEHIVFSDKPAGADVFSIAGTVDTVEPLGHTTLVRRRWPRNAGLTFCSRARCASRKARPVTHKSSAPSLFQLATNRSELRLVSSN